MSYDITILGFDQKKLETLIDTPFRELLETFQKTDANKEGTEDGETYLVTEEKTIYCKLAARDVLGRTKPLEEALFFSDANKKVGNDKELARNLLSETPWSFYTEKHWKESFLLFQHIINLEGCGEELNTRSGCGYCLYGDLWLPGSDLITEFKETDSEAARIWHSFFSNRTWPIFNFFNGRKVQRPKQTQDEANSGEEYGFVDSEEVKKFVESGEKFWKEHEADGQYERNFPAFIASVKNNSRPNLCIMTQTDF